MTKLTVQFGCVHFTVNEKCLKSKLPSVQFQTFCINEIVIAPISEDFLNLIPGLLYFV